VLLTFPRVLGERDPLTWTVQSTLLAIMIDIYYIYPGKIYLVVFFVILVCTSSYVVTDAVFHFGCFAVANKAKNLNFGSVYGRFWYQLIMPKYARVERSNAAEFDLSASQWIISLLIPLVAVFILNFA
jgi:hypothetical protein